ncbi:MFS transporter [Actinoplanes sp. NPDC051851]|uniref:MFS transporter n=1 Tax=Actinoplanes sp. NPDC051851 TaxID=3154753 RepID=UPI00342270FB
MTSSRGATLTVLCAVALMVVLDSTIVAVAIPAIQRDLGFTQAGVAWVVNGYLVAFAGLLILAGRLGDILGDRRVFLTGLAVFTAASLLCGLAPNAGLLVAGRFVQGIGGAFASAVVLGMIVRLYPEPGPQARAMGIFSFTQAGGAAIGFVAGGVLTDLAGWPAIFLINVPIGVVAWLVARRLLSGGTTVGGRLDILGALLITLSLSLVVFAIVRAVDLVAAAAAVVAFALFLVRQAVASTPLVPPHLLRRGWLLATNGTVVLILAAGMGFQFVNTLFLQRVMGLDTLHTGLAFLPTPVVIGLVSLFAAARLTARLGPRPVLIAGLALLVAGLFLLSRAPLHPSYATDLLPGLVVMGLGVGVTVPSIMMLAMAGASPEETGLISGLNNTAQQAGASLGLATLAAVAAHRVSATPSPSAFHDAYTSAFLVAACFAAAALFIAVLALRHPPSAPSAPAASAPAALAPTVPAPAIPASAPAARCPG